MRKLCPEGYAMMWQAVDAIVPNKDTRLSQESISARVNRCRDLTLQALCEYAKVLDGDARRRCEATLTCLLSGRPFDTIGVR